MPPPVYPMDCNEPPCRPLRVLTVDDNVDAATSLAVLLEAMGCATAVAFKPQDALRVIREFRPELLFIDLHMPGTDGCELLSQARSVQGERPDPLFVCLTGSGDLLDEQRCIDAGFHGFVRKPIEPWTIDLLLARAQAHAAGQ